MQTKFHVLRSHNFRDKSDAKFHIPRSHSFQEKCDDNLQKFKVAQLS